MNTCRQGQHNTITHQSKTMTAYENNESQNNVMIRADSNPINFGGNQSRDKGA